VKSKTHKVQIDPLDANAGSRLITIVSGASLGAGKIVVLVSRRDWHFVKDAIRIIERDKNVLVHVGNFLSGKIHVSWIE
jgi:hypothetical protein